MLAFLVPTSQHTTALNGVHCDAGHQGQHRTLALAQECFWWPMMAEEYRALVRGCLRCRTFEGVVPKAPLCPIRVHIPLELVQASRTCWSLQTTYALHSGHHHKRSDGKDCGKSFIRKVYHSIWCASKASQQPGGKLYLSTCRRVVCHVWHPEMLNHHIPPTMQWAS